MVDVLNFGSKVDNDRIKEIFERIYHLNSNEYSWQENEGHYSVTVSSQKVINAMFFVTVSSDEMSAFLSLYPPVNDGRKIEFESINEELINQKIKFGLKDESIREALSISEFGNIIERVPIAKGSEAIDGKDAVIVTHFEKSKKKELSATDKVDYRDVSNIINVKQGDLLVTKKPPTKGSKGVTVRNADILPKEGKDIEITILEGVKSDVEGLNFYAEIDGYVHFYQNKIAVYPIYKVKNVNYSVGNIDFNGTVYVSEDVLFGFKVEAQKDIIVEGVCDDSTLIANESILIKRGIKGKGQNLFKARTHFECGYCENANVYSEGNIFIKKYSYNSNLFSRNEIIATEGNGVLAGGHICAYSTVSCLYLGAKGVSNFIVKVGEDYLMEDEINQANSEADSVGEAINKVSEALSGLDLKSKAVLSNPKVIKLLQYKKSLLEKKNDLVNKIIELKKKTRHPKPKIKVKNTVFEGVTIQIYDKKVKIRERMENMLFFLEPKYEDIGWISLKEVSDIEQ